MKETVNFLPQKPEKKAESQGKRMIRLGSFVILAVFLIFNLTIFGFYFFLRKNAGDALENINRQEAVITSLRETETLYRQLKQKLSFLTVILGEPQKINDGLAFINGLLGPEALLEKMNLNQDGSVVLDLSSSDSSNLESFLNKVRQLEQDGKIKDLKIDSVKKSSIDTSQSDYKFVLTFKLNHK